MQDLDELHDLTLHQRKLAAHNWPDDFASLSLKDCMYLPRPIPADRLTDAQRQRAITAILIGQFFILGGFFMVIPLMAVHYVDSLGWAAGTVGIILALRQFFQQAITAFFGVLCDRIGPKPLLLAGVILRILAFVALGYSTTFLTVLGSSLLVALSGSMFESPRAAALSALALPEERQRVFSKVGVAGGIGTAIGTQIGALLINQDFALVCLAGAAAFVCVFVVIYFLMPHVGINIVTTGTGESFRTVLQDRVFVIFLLLLTGHWFAYTQFGLTVTLAATDISGDKGAVAWIYLVQTIVTVALGYMLPRMLEKWITPLKLLIYGTAVMGVGLLLVGWSGSITFILFAAAVYSIGSVIARPGQETVTANLAKPSAQGAYFGIASWSLAIGGGLGNYLGGVIYDAGKTTNPALPWIIFATITIGSSVGMWFVRKPLSEVRNVRRPVIRRAVEETQKPGTTPKLLRLESRSSEPPIADTLGDDFKESPTLYTADRPTRDDTP